MNDKQSGTGIQTPYIEACNRLCKWRTVLVGWMVGTKASTAPGVQSYRDAADQRLLMRVEISALTSLLIAKGVFTHAEMQAQVVEECGHLQRVLEQKFPGYRATDAGIAIDAAEAKKTNERLGFPL